MFRSFYYFIRLLVLQRDIIWSMAKREIAHQYMGSLLGFVWTFVHPVILVLVFWVIFSLGFRVQPSENAPFVVWLTCGMAAWFVFADMVNGSVGAVIHNANLIKKTLFHSQILPIVKIVAALITHGIFLVVLLVLILFHRLPFDWCYLQFVYYLLALTVLALGIGWMGASLTVFIRDVSQVAGVFVQIGFWATPIFWSPEMMPEGIRDYVWLNPMAYVVQGYRDSFIYFVPFWERPVEGIYFWCVAGALFVLGALVFKRLKPHFADVL